MPRAGTGPSDKHNRTMSTKANGTPDYGTGYLEISEKGFGFLRSAENHFQPKPTDIFVTPDTIKKNFLREGSLVAGPLQPPHRGTSPQLREVDKVNGMPFTEYTKAVRFENLTTIDPTVKFQLETGPDLIETRIIDLVTPLGKGTRGLIVAPPRTGKTTILKQIANAITANHPDVHVLVLLIDERPEEVTDFQRSVTAEVVASSNDQDIETHVRLSRFMIERSRRMVESGKDVVILLDSLTRVARAYNSVHGGSDRRLFPAIDIPKSGTRKEEKLFPKNQIEAVRKLRRMMVDLNPVEAMETLLAALKKHKTNDELLAKLEKGS